MATDVIVTDEWTDWWSELTEDQQEKVGSSIGLLEARGVTLGYPHSSDIKGATFPLRELRIQAGGDPLRTFYAFDPSRQAVLLIGGDKTGESDDRFYGRMIPTAERIWKDYLDETRQSKPKREK